ncbi:hypothetical protein [Amycolatopsis orientalis]|uniref:hypothetical protein n=1 Tax=Amycolatopsis orientalis TaxID=31958 RepID=UPI00041FB753|nr:hypothetical protein [Amycolatopsis orientalis]
MTTVRPSGSSQTPSGGDAPNRRLPLRWLVIGVISALAAASAYAASGQSAAILVAVGVAAALHKMID